MSNRTLPVKQVITHLSQPLNLVTSLHGLAIYEVLRRFYPILFLLTSALWDQYVYRRTSSTRLHQPM